MVAAFAVTGFVSCSDDDDDDNDDIVTYYVLTKYKENQEKNALCGTYTGTMTVTMGTRSIPASVKAVVAIDSIDLSQSSSNYGTYSSVFWFKDSDGNWVIAARANANEDTDVTVDNYTDKSVCGVYITFGDSVVMTIPAMASMGGTSTLTKSE